jgi:hypothetical protein
MTETKPVYHYDSDTGAYLFSRPAPVDPKSGRVMAPRFSTTDAPPPMPDDEVACYRDADGSTPTHDGGGAWWRFANYVGRAYWLPDGTGYEITALGVTPPANATLTPPPSPYHTRHNSGSWFLDELRLRYDKIAEIAEQADKAAARLYDADSQIEREINLKMELEARAYADNKKAPTPLIDRKVGSKTKAEWVKIILAKSDALNQKKARIVEAQHARVDELYAAIEKTETDDELYAVVTAFEAWPAATGLG